MQSLHKILSWGVMGVFALIVIFGTLLVIDWMETQLTPEVIISEESIPEFLKLQAEPKDVLFAEAYVNGSGEEELRYAYVAGEVEASPGEAIDRRTPNSRTEVLSIEQKGNEVIENLKTSFYTAPQFYEDNGQWRQIEYATTTPEIFSASGAIKYVQRREWWERLLPGKPLFAQTSTFRPDPNIETSSVDGWISIEESGTSGVEGTCQVARAAADGTSTNETGTTLLVSLYQAAQDNPPILENAGEDVFFCDIYRTFLLFDTASLPDNAIISSASVRLYGISVNQSLIPDIVITSSTPASNTTLAFADYDQVGDTSYASIGIGSIAVGSYNTFNLNSSGIANISLTGVTKKAVRNSDELNAGFAFIVDGALSDSVTFSSADVSGTSQDPELQVTYTAGSFSFGQWFPF